MVDVRDCGEYNSVAWEAPESRQRAVKMYKWLQNNCNTSNLRSRLAHSSGVFLAGDWVRVWLNAVFPQKKRGQTFFPALSIYEHRKIAFIAMKKQSRYLDFLLLQIKRFVIIRNYFNPFFIFEKEAVVRALWKKKLDYEKWNTNTPKYEDASKVFRRDCAKVWYIPCGGSHLTTTSFLWSWHGNEVGLGSKMGTGILSLLSSSSSRSSTREPKQRLLKGTQIFV